MKKLLLAAAALMLLCPSVDARPKSKKNVTHKSNQKAKPKPTYYYGAGTSAAQPTDATRPSAYKGDRVPENDGLKKNKERNMNYTSQPALSK